MATKPLQVDPSGPDTEYSQVEPVLVLRTAKSLILPLRVPMPLWEEQPFASLPLTRSTEAFPVVAFKATTHVFDPGTQRTHTVTLSIGPGIDDGSANMFLQSESIRNEGNWRAHLYRGTDLRAAVPFVDQKVELHRGLSAGFYTVKLTRANAPVSHFNVALEPFSLPEALEAGETYVARRQYIRAEAVLSDAAERYPENADTQDLLVLADALSTADPAGYEEEQAKFGVMRSRSDTARHLRELLASTKARFGKRMVSLFAARSLDRAAIPDEVITKIAQETASIVVIQVMAAFKERLKEQEAGLKDELMQQVLEGVTQRLEGVDVLRRELADLINRLRHDPVKSDDEKFGAVEIALKGFGDELARRNLRTADYEAFFAEKLGQPCWQWISRDARKIFMESEDHYRHSGSRPFGDKPDFTAGLLDLCRGLELLLNEKLGAISVEIARRVLDNTQAMLDAGPVLPMNMRGSLRKRLEELLEKSQKKKSLGITEIALQLHIGKAAKRVLGDDARVVLVRSPGPADVEQLAILNLITSEYRNDKMHLTPDSPHKFTEREEMQALRKLVFGIDEEKSVQQKGILEGIRKTSWLPPQETTRATDRVSKGWRKLPGIVPVLWMALGDTTKITAA